MPIAATRPVADDDLVGLAGEAAAALEALLADATAKVRERVSVEDRVVGKLFEREQRATHGLAWLATYVEAVRQLAAYAERMTDNNAFGEVEEHLGVCRHCCGELEFARQLRELLGKPSDAVEVTPEVRSRLEAFVKGLRETE